MSNLRRRFAQINEQYLTPSKFLLIRSNLRPLICIQFTSVAKLFKSNFSPSVKNSKRRVAICPPLPLCCFYNYINSLNFKLTVSFYPRLSLPSYAQLLELYNCFFLCSQLVIWRLLFWPQHERKKCSYFLPILPVGSIAVRHW